MASSTTNLDTLTAAQASKEVTANALFDAGSPPTIFGRRASTTTALTWGYYGGRFRNSSGVYSTIANATITLTASNTNYVEVTVDGVIPLTVGQHTVEVVAFVSAMNYLVTSAYRIHLANKELFLLEMT
jgi:hypothetical protein